MSILSFLYLVGPYPLNVGMNALSFLYHAWATFLEYGIVWFTFPIPCWAYPWNVGNVWFVSLLCVLALCMMYMCVYIYIYMFVWLWVVMHFVWWTPMVRRAAFLWSWVLLTLWCGYALKAIAIGAYSYYIVCMIITVCLSWSMSASDIGFPIYVTCINMLDALVSFSLPLYEHDDARRIHRHKTLPVCHSTPNAKLYWIFAMKMKHLCCCILIVKA